MTDCIIIPQWWFAIAGMVSVGIGTALHFKYVRVPSESIPIIIVTWFLFMFGLCGILLGLLPYLPCITVVP